jgi:transposase-like protein
MANVIKNAVAVKKEVVRLLMAGESISKICEREDMPTRNTVYRWMTKDTGFREIFRDARHTQASELIIQSLAIADREKATSNDLSADRLRINTRLKLAAMLGLRKFS